MSKVLIFILSLGVLVAIATAGAALVFGYTAMIVMGFAAFLVLGVVGWLVSEFG